MGRDLSVTALAAMYARETGEAALWLLRLTHENLSTPIRVVNDWQGLTSNGAAYSPFPFEITMPEQVEGRQPVVQLKIDAVDQTLIEQIRTVVDPIHAVAELVLASEPDTVLAAFGTDALPLTWRNITWDLGVIEGELRGPEIFDNVYPKDAFTPDLFPGLF